MLICLVLADVSFWIVYNKSENDSNVLSFKLYNSSATLEFKNLIDDIPLYIEFVSLSGKYSAFE